PSSWSVSITTHACSKSAAMNSSSAGRSEGFEGIEDDDPPTLRSFGAAREDEDDYDGNQTTTKRKETHEEQESEVRSQNAGRRAGGGGGAGDGVLDLGPGVRPGSDADRATGRACVHEHGRGDELRPDDHRTHQRGARNECRLG